MVKATVVSQYSVMKATVVSQYSVMKATVVSQCGEGDCSESV